MKQRKERLPGKLLQQGLPPLGDNRISLSLQPSDTSKTKVNCDKKYQIIPNSLFGIVEEFSLDKLKEDETSVIWRMAKHAQGNLPSWHCENDIENFVKTALQDILALLELDENLEIHSRITFSLKDLIPDLTVFRVRGTIIGLCEMKMPSFEGTGDLNFDELYDQIVSYMQILSNIHGIIEVFAIITTYIEWKFLWLDESNDLVQITSLPALQEYGSSNETILSAGIQNMNLSERKEESVVDGTDEKNDGLETENEEEEENEAVSLGSFEETEEAEEDDINENFNEDSESNERKLDENVISVYETSVFRFDEVALIEILCSIILKMSYVHIRPSTVFSGQQPASNYIFVNEDTYFWVPLPKNLSTSLDFEESRRKCLYYYLLQDYHGGRDGRVWLAVNRGGVVCVVKLSEKKQYEKESVAWKQIWGIKARLQKLCKCNALIMPYVFHAFRQEKGRISFRSLRKWNFGESDIRDFTENGTKQRIDERSILKYFNNPELAAKHAITSMVEKGYFHLDLKWEHIGLLPQKIKNGTLYKVKPILIDLHDIRELTIEEKQNPDSVVKDLLDQLEKQKI